MSRGPGRRQRELLDAVADSDVGVRVTEPTETVSEQSAWRRAAYTLERAGKITLGSVYVEGTPRLVAYRPGTGVPFHVSTGGGKAYRHPSYGFPTDLWHCVRTEARGAPRLWKSDDVVTVLPWQAAGGRRATTDPGG